MPDCIENQTGFGKTVAAIMAWEIHPDCVYNEAEQNV
jgi:hypothetical protein